MENRLEAECKDLEEQKEILKSALNKWSNARFLLVYAYNQLQCSEVRWIDLMKMNIKYVCAFFALKFQVRPLNA